VTDESLDLRLVPAAGAAWAGAVVAVLGDERAVKAVAVPAAATVLVSVVLEVVLAHPRSLDRHQRRSGVAGGRRVCPGLRAGAAHSRATAGGAASALGAALLAATVLLGVLAVGAAQRHERTAGPLAAAASSSWTATLRGVVADDPVPLATTWGGGSPRVRYTLAVDTVQARDRTSRAHGAVVVLGRGEAPAAGATVVVAGRLQPPASRTDRVVGVLVADASARTERGPGGVHRWVDAVRSSARAVVGQVPGDAGAMLLGVALGDTARVDAGLSDALAVAGLTHLVAVSGAHFAILGALVAAAASACRLPTAARAGAVLLAGVLLVLLVGPQPSVLRAAVMGVVSLVGLLAGRPSRAPAALASAVVVLLLVDPWLATELGFALSVAATAAIVLLGGAWAQRWATRLGRGLAAGLAVPLAAQLACGPVLLAARPGVGTYAVVANVLVAPAVGPATVLGVAAALLAPLWPAGALVLAHLGGAACWWVAAVGRTVAAAPGASIGWAPGWVGVLALAGASTAVAALLLRAGRPPPGGPAGTGAPGGRRLSVRSGRLGACPRLPPAVRAVRRRESARPR
jgi:competence protein ComEC